MAIDHLGRLEEAMEDDVGRRPLRLVVVDDQEFAREAVAAALDDEPGLETVGQAGTVTQARDVIVRVEPDVVVLDLRLPDGTGRDLLTHFAGQVTPRFVIYTSGVTQLEEEELIDLGAAAVVLKSLRSNGLVGAIRLAGQSTLASSPD